MSGEGSTSRDKNKICSHIFNSRGAAYFHVIMKVVIFFILLTQPF